MQLRPAARVAVIGAGPGGLVAARNALGRGLRVTVFEASDDLGGQWHTEARHSGVWRGMRTNTSRTMTAFSDLDVPPEHELYPTAEQVHAYLRAYADTFGITDKIRFATPVTRLHPGWLVDDEPYDAVIIASGRFRRPRTPELLQQFTGELLHSFDYPGAEHIGDRRTLVSGNGVSGHEIASDIATMAPVASAYRKSRYVLQKVVDGVPSDWRWYTHVHALQRARMDRDDYSAMLRDRVVRTCGDPASFGAPPPDPDILVAGHSLCQDHLIQVRDGAIRCRPEIVGIAGRTVTFADGHEEEFDTVISATGFDLDIPYLSDEIGTIVGPQLRLHHRTFHPDLPGLAVVGQYALQGPYWPLLELQARWIAGVWSGSIPAPDPAAMRASVTADPPELDSHHVLALALAEASGVAPDLRAHPDLVEALLLGPLLPSRYRLDGPGSQPDAQARSLAQLATSPRPAPDPADLDMLAEFAAGDPELSAAATAIRSSVTQRS